MPEFKLQPLVKMLSINDTVLGAIREVIEL